MSVKDIPGIRLTSGFVLLAEDLLDKRCCLPTEADRNELVAVGAAPVGIIVYVKESKRTYQYNGDGNWEYFSKGAEYKHPTGDGNLHVPKTGTTNKDKFLRAGATAGSLSWVAITPLLIGASESNHHHTNDTIDNLDADKLTGTLNIQRFPNAALSRCVPVDNDTARFALTTDTVQTGDTVKVKDTGVMYYVTDDTKLDRDAGYEPYVSETARTIPYSGVTDAPKSLPNEKALTIKLNNGSAEGTDMFTYIGSKEVLVNITPDGIGASAKDHTHAYLPLAGGTMSGAIKSTVVSKSFLAANNGDAIINSIAEAGAFTALAKMNSANGFFVQGITDSRYILAYTSADTVESDTYTHRAVLLNENGNTVFPGIVYATGFDGNATSATKLNTARTIDGISFDGSDNIMHYGTCNTIATTADKTVTIPGFVLTTGARVYVKFANTNTAISPTLNVNKTGAKPILCHGPFGNYNNPGGIGGVPVDTLYGICEFVYSGSNWVMIDSRIKVVDNLTTAFSSNTSQGLALGAYQGKILNDKIDNLPKIRYGTDLPNDSVGKDGDIYIQILNE